MKYSLRGVGRNNIGYLTPNENINIYESGTNIPAKVYLNEDDTEYIDTVPQLTTDENGYFHIYLDTDDYDNADISFDLTIADEFTINDYKLFSFIKYSDNEFGFIDCGTF
jgi:hypothetical protein